MELKTRRFVLLQIIEKRFGVRIKEEKEYVIIEGTQKNMSNLIKTTAGAEK